MVADFGSTFQAEGNSGWTVAEECSEFARTTTLNSADGSGPAGMICVAGAVITENGGTTASGIDHDSPCVLWTGVRATAFSSPSCPSMEYTTLAVNGGGGRARV